MNKQNPPAARPTQHMLVRVMEILSMANSPSGCPTASTLATHFGTSTRTIKTDLALIRDQLYLELRWDQGSKTYHLAPGSRVPTWTSLSDTDTHALYVARAMIESSQPDLLDAFDEMLNKLECLFPQRVFGNIHRIESLTSLTHHGQSRCSIQQLLQISQALIQRQDLELVYRKSPIAPQETRTVTPSRIIFHRNTFYLRAYDLNASGYRNFALPRIDSVKPIPSSTTPPPDPQGSMGFGLFRSANPTHVRIRFSDWAAVFAAERHWTPNQTITWESPDTVILEFPSTDDHRELAGWVLGFGNCAEVLSPEPLRQQLLEHVRQLSARYSVPAPD